jgi:hypothetical protein
MDGWMDEWMDEWMNKWIDGCCRNGGIETGYE